MSQLYIVEVDDQCNPHLAGHAGCSYTSPPTRSPGALALVRTLLKITRAAQCQVPADASRGRHRQCVIRPYPRAHMVDLA